MSQRISLSEHKWINLSERYRYYGVSFEKISNVWVDEGLFKSSVILIRRQGGPVTFPNIGKNDARDFVAQLSACLENDNELSSQRTKVCPQCDEFVKYRAKQCKYCGYDFE